MGVSFRVFLVHDGDFERMALSKFERIALKRSRERLKPLADKRVRYVLLTIETHERKPVRVLRMDPGFLKFDQEGRLDESESLEEARLAMTAIAPPMFGTEGAPKVLDARRRFASRRLEHEYRWKISPELRSRLTEAVIPRRTIAG